MNTLFIDTHGEVVVLAIYRDEKLMKKKESKERKDHSTICMPLLVELLTESKLDIKDINDIVVVNAPGSFTGVRIGVTIAKTLAFTLNIWVVFDALTLPPFIKIKLSLIFKLLWCARATDKLIFWVVELAVILWICSK